MTNPISTYKELPCKNCLIFPVCKAQVIDYINNNVHIHKCDPLTRAYIIYQNVLSSKCSILNDRTCESSETKGNIVDCLELLCSLFISYPPTYIIQNGIL